MPEPTLIFDGDCAFCRPWVERWRANANGALRTVPLQEWTAAEPPREQLTRAIHFIDGDGRTYRAAEAVFRVLALHPDSAWPLWLYQHGLKPFAETVYRWVADHRSAAMRFATFAWGGAVPPSYDRVRSVFLRGLAVIYAIAFVSFWVQAMGLIGARGIWPVGEYMTAVKASLGAHAWTEMPTLFLLGTGDGFIHAVCALGVVLSVALAVGAWPRAALFGLWALYLSLEHAGYLFLGYQWDLLLLEVGLLAIPFAPAGFWPRTNRRPPSFASLFLLRLLLFRLMFMSGIVKLTSGDETWRNLTALRYHYWSQPLPTWTAALANDLPLWVASLSCVVMFAIEIGAPFLIFGGRWMRIAGGAALVFLQVMILLTGNYGFFNWLTLLLCVLLLDDRILRGKAPEPAGAMKPAVRWIRRTALGAFFVIFLASGLSEMALQLRGRREPPAFLASLVELLEPLRSVNSYGLFRVMTTDRREIIVEGSDDGVTWKPYEFKWKPGRVDRRPGFVAPHQPRLDWQMWFAALGACRHNTWFLAFQQRLLEGSPPVIALLEENPFPSAPPRFVRSTLYQYRFASAEERRRGTWWTRAEVGPYCPELTLKNGQLSTP